MIAETRATLKFDHLTLPVRDLKQSRSWYVDMLGLTVEFEVPDRQAVAVQDSDGFTIFLQQAAAAVVPNDLALYFQVADVDATFGAWSERGLVFAHAPAKTYWGYGAELRDPDGYLIRLWDEQTMKTK
ncbi:MAG TPA: VOC family protein [Methylomirabilota bacterium]|jgi:catechol 2,3-dioxygenase-like lactoylglutathione lyase family enzyme